MVPDNLRTRLATSDPLLGGWISMRDPLAAEVAFRAGYDYVCIDSQHGLHSYDMIASHLHAGSGGNAFPLVRVPWNEQGFIGRMLDLGAMGVIVPMVNSAAEARAAVTACRYAPLGARSFGPAGAGTRFGGEYYSKANDNVACIPMVETVQAVENVDDIVSVPGVDAVYVGPADLSITMGLPPGMDQDNRDFDAALAKVVDACNRAGVIPGIHSAVELVAKRRDQGFKMITVGNDLGHVIAGLNGSVRDARKRLA
jgi:4-hydroxy-2-oxoheptanedioate aldolase